MDEFVPLAIALFGIYLFYYWWTKRMRYQDLMRVLENTLQELREDTYEVRTWVGEHGEAITELSGDMCRIRHTESRFGEAVFANRFFRNRETSGANVARVSRTTAGGGSMREVNFGLRHHFHGRVLSHAEGVATDREIHAVFDNMVVEIRKHRETKTPS